MIFLSFLPSFRNTAATKLNAAAFHSAACKSTAIQNLLWCQFRMAGTCKHWVLADAFWSNQKLDNEVPVVKGVLRHVQGWHSNYHGCRCYIQDRRMRTTHFNDVLQTAQVDGKTWAASQESLSYAADCVPDSAEMRSFQQEPGLWL